MQAATITMAGGAFAYVLVAALGGTLGAIAQPVAGPATLAIAIVVGTVGAGIPTLAFLNGIRRLGPPRAAILATLEPVVGVALGALLLREIPSPVQLLGGLLVIGGGVLSQLSGGSPPAEHEAVATLP